LTSPTDGSQWRVRGSFRLGGVVLLAAFILAGCTTMVPKELLPSPVTTDAMADPVKVITIPLPVIAASPNEGVTAGGLSAFLIHNRQDEIATLLAPQINQNPNFGTTFSFYGAFYPSRQQSWELSLAKSTRVNENFELRGIDSSLLAGKLELNGYLFRLRDGSSRFYGFQSGATRDGETNYANDEYGVTAAIGYQVGKHYQVVVGERLRSVDITPGAVRDVPYTRDRYSPDQVPGLNGFTAHAQRVSFVYSTLDTPSLATFGGYARATAEVSTTLLGSSADYRHYEVELKGYVPVDNARYVSVFRLMYNQTLGDDVPFLERSILGGETTLRGYGRNRFIDSSFILCNLEERIRLVRWEIFGVTADWELAPFIDLGLVTRSLTTADAQDFEFNPGIGIRAVVRPNIVGRLDIGIGRDGPALFLGLGYPF